MTRPHWDDFFLAFARNAATRGTCNRKRVGAVIVLNKHVISTGYNGAPAGWDSCDDAGHQMVRIGDTESCVRSVHAEENAILQCARNGVSPIGGTLYTTAATCYECLKRVAQVGIREIVYAERYDGGRDAGLNIDTIAVKAGIGLRRLT